MIRTVVSFLLLSLCAFPPVCPAGELSIPAAIEESDRLQKAGDFQQALVVLQNAMRAHAGPEDSTRADLLHREGVLLQELGKYAEAEAAFREAVRIRTALHGPEHFTIGALYNELAMAVENQTRFDEADELYRKSLEMRKKTLGPDHVEVASTLNAHAWFLYSQGKYSDAEALYREALRIREMHLGSEHPEVATVMNNYGLLLQDQGRYAEAESLLVRALRIREASLGSEHAYAGTSLNNLAIVYRGTGRFEEAAQLYERALKIMERVYGAEHPNIATVLGNLGKAYRVLKQFEKAKAALERSLAIREAVLGPEHPHLVFTLGSIGLLHRDEGRLEEAEAALRRAVRIRELKLGADHPLMPFTLQALAEVLLDRGKFEEAEALLQRALELRKRSSFLHPDSSDTLISMAILNSNKGLQEKSSTYFQDAMAIRSEVRDAVFSLLSDRQKLTLTSLQEADLHSFLSHTFQFGSKNAAALRTAFETWLRWKGSVLEAQGRYMNSLVRTNPESQRVWAELQDVRRRLGRLWVTGAGRLSPDEYESTLREIQKKKEELEAELTRLSAAFQESDRASRISIDVLSETLPADSVYIDFAFVRWFDFSRRKTSGGRYVAFVLTRGSRDPRILDFGDANELEGLAHRALDAVRQRADHRTIRRYGRALYDRVWAPLEEMVAKSRSVFVSPDGFLHQFPLEILIGPDGKSLLEKHEIVYVAAGRDLLRYQKEQSAESVVMADPDSEYLRSIDRADPPLRNLRFDPLPGARREGEAVARILREAGSPAHLYVGKEASEDVLLKSEAPRVLHLAVHGFFLPDSASSFSDHSLTTLEGQVPVDETEKALLRSGILLSSVKPADEGSDAGIVTAEKILGMNLRGTELVTLSGCETGRGSLRYGQGVFGLRRAFVLAGAETLVMSVWQVSDAATYELMQRFYSLWTSGQTRSAAFRKARLELAKDYPEPYYWGAFVLLGNPN